MPTRFIRWVFAAVTLAAMLAVVHVLPTGEGRAGESTVVVADDQQTQLQNDEDEEQAADAAQQQAEDQNEEAQQQTTQIEQQFEDSDPQVIQNAQQGG